MVFSGDTLHLLAGFSSKPAGEVRVTISGAACGEMQLPCAVSDPVNLETLPRVAAARRLASLDDEEAGALAEQYQLVSAHTSFVVVQTRAEGEKAETLPELKAVGQMLADQPNLRIAAATDTPSGTGAACALATSIPSWRASPRNASGVPRAPVIHDTLTVLAPAVSARTCIGSASHVVAPQSGSASGRRRPVSTLRNQPGGSTTAPIGTPRNGSHASRAATAAS